MESKIILLDGGMGTMLQAAGMKAGEHPEVYGKSNPQIVKDIHRKYREAGSDIVYANTFGANRYKLEGTGVTVEEAVMAAVQMAKQESKRVALDVGPVGELLEPIGTLAFEDAYDIYAEMMIAGEKAGADLIVIETFTDLCDARAAVLAAKENTSLPVWVTMSFEANGRTFTGTTVASMAMTLTGLGADAMGINCSLGPDEIYPLLKEMSEWTNLPLIVKPNAGLPDPSTGEYGLNAESFAEQMKRFAEMGVMAMGGCCGTTPEFICELKKMLESGVSADSNIDRKIRRGVCSPVHVTEFTGVRVIGERLNPTGKKRFGQALRDKDMDYIQRVALEQEESGADILDVNVGLPGTDEAELMPVVIRALQGIISLPLQIDSSNPNAVEAGLRAYNGRAIINSVNGNEETLRTILPLAKKYGAAVIGLTLDHHGIPKTAEERYQIANRIMDTAAEYGIPKEDLLIDCLTLTVSAQQDQAMETLKAVRRVHEELGLHCTLGVSNISFGLPERIHVAENFLTQAMYCGLDFPIINPNQEYMMDAVASYKVLSGEDVNCEAYIQRFAKTEPATGVVSAVGTADNGEASIEIAIKKGLKAETAEIARKMLESMTELEVINEKLIPALDVVGELYEKQIIFLPQLINSANAACAAFDLIKARIAAKGEQSASKGKIVLATVEGDIHDIGKNIVKVILENYGYQIIDLGRDVPVQKVVEAVLKEDVKLVGLSALMTTTLPAMAKTIEELRKSGHECRVWVGGAVLTPDYASEIGADYYAKDARESVEIAKMVLD